MEIKKIILNKSNGQMLVYVPLKSEFKPGDYVKLIKIEDEKSL